MLELNVLDNPLWAWGLALAITLGVVLAVKLVHRIAGKRVSEAAARTKSDADDAVLRVLARTHGLFVLAVGLYVGSRYLDLDPRADRALDLFLTVAVALQVGRWGSAALEFFFERHRQRAARTDAGATTAIAALSFAARFLMWVLLLLLALDNLGVDVTAMVAGLGIGGIAVALAVQNILGDLFASVSIIVDRPFVVGDFIIVDDYMGTVEHVGLKTTHVRSLGGEQIIFANNDLLKTRVRNYKRMYERRVVFTFGVEYGTSPQQLKDVAEFLRALVTTTPRTRLERAHFFKFGESSLDFEVAYWVQDPDYNAYMDIQQNFNLRIMEQLAARKVAFAFPTRTVAFAQALKLDSETTRQLPDPDQGARNKGVRDSGSGRDDNSIRETPTPPLNAEPSSPSMERG
jgi:small-conductance mechanosensitive channel